MNITCQQNIYDFSVKNMYGNEVSLNRYKNKVLLVINISTKCAFSHQISSLQKLNELFNEKDFQILAFPSDNFERKKGLYNYEIIKSFIKKNCHSFELFSKINVVGKEIHPIYQFLYEKSKSKPLWNFHKYLINKNGDVVDYYFTFTNPTSKRLINKIKKCLDE